jgi:hypothetical protein
MPLLCVNREISDAVFGRHGNGRISCLPVRTCITATSPVEHHAIKQVFLAKPTPTQSSAGLTRQQK